MENTNNQYIVIKYIFTYMPLDTKIKNDKLNVFKKIGIVFIFSDKKQNTKEEQLHI